MDQNIAFYWATLDKLCQNESKICRSIWMLDGVLCWIELFNCTTCTTGMESKSLFSIWTFNWVLCWIGWIWKALTAQGWRGLKKWIQNLLRSRARRSLKTHTISKRRSSSPECLFSCTCNLYVSWYDKSNLRRWSWNVCWVCFTEHLHNLWSDKRKQKSTWNTHMLNVHTLWLLGIWWWNKRLISNSCSSCRLWRLGWLTNVDEAAADKLDLVQSRL